MYRFEKLRVYNDALDLIEKVYKLTKTFPNDELFSLTDQIKRASTSIALNIAEGTGSSGDKEFRSFLRISLKSLYETVSALKLANRLFGVKIESVLENCDLVGKELNSLIRSLAKDQ